MIRKFLCKIGLHYWIDRNMGNDNYIDSSHGYLEQDECKYCGKRSIIREYY